MDLDLTPDPTNTNILNVTQMYIYFYFLFHSLWALNLVGLSLQDMRLALGLAESVSQSTPIAAAANELYKVAKSHGLSDHDFSAVIEALKVKLKD